MNLKCECEASWNGDESAHAYNMCLHKPYVLSIVFFQSKTELLMNSYHNSIHF